MEDLIDGGPQLEIQILTAMGEDVRTIHAPARPGAHEVVWDFRIDPAYEPKQDEPEREKLRARGPTVPPNVYQIRMDVGETTMFGDITVRQDPRIDISRADLAARQAALMSIYELQGPVYHTREAGRRLHMQLSDVERLLGDTEAAESFGNEMKVIKEVLDDLDEDLNRLPIGTARQIEASTTRPTEDQLQAVERAWRDAPELIGQLNAVILARVPALYRRMNDDRIQADPGEPLEVPRRRGEQN